MMDQFPQRASKPYSLLWRGLIKSCPVCGERQLFSKWVKMVERCPKCNLRFERIEGQWVGAVGMNTIFSFTLLFLGLAILFFVTYPDIPMGGWVFVFAGGYGFVPLLFYPSSKTLWTAIDILMRPLEDEDFDESV